VNDAGEALGSVHSQQFPARPDQLNTKSLIKTAIVFLAVPFSLVEAFWSLYLLGYNTSVAVWVGVIALARSLQPTSNGDIEEV